MLPVIRLAHSLLSPLICACSLLRCFSQLSRHFLRSPGMSRSFLPPLAVFPSTCFGWKQLARPSSTPGLLPSLPLLPVRLAPYPSSLVLLCRRRPITPDTIKIRAVPFGRRELHSHIHTTLNQFVTRELQQLYINYLRSKFCNIREIYSCGCIRTI